MVNFASIQSFLKDANKHIFKRLITCSNSFKRLPLGNFAMHRMLSNYLERNLLFLNRVYPRATITNRFFNIFCQL